ncbi:HAD-IC family P-type ATPase [Gordonia sp. CPCC 206044]|uniref:HAD-IC family P-type ATPase n=1 Tax=Gordonia sp. CPCC 206044 TaxID=3140793 RepID=UPI003AF3BD2B
MTQTSTDTAGNPGLTATEVAQRVAAGQVNDLPARSGRTVRDIVRANVFTRINAILGVLFVIVASTGSLINGLFGLLIIANSGIGIIQEIRAKQTLDRLAIVGQTTPMVRRDGQVVALAPDQIVLDDIIEIGAGDQVVVDGETVESVALDVDESLLTGEADPVDKSPGDKILSGSFVVAGSGAYRATKVGADAYAAQLAAEASKFTLVASELRSGIDQILRVITWLLVPAGILTIVNQLFISRSGLKSSLLGMVAALVPMVPEGLVLMTSIAFAVGVVRLGQRKCLVNELPAIEGLARVNVVCADKTGTLTENGMRLSELRPVGTADAEPPAADDVAGGSERATRAGRAVDERSEGSVRGVGRVGDERGAGSGRGAGRVVDERGAGSVRGAGRVVDERGEGAVPVAGRVVDERGEGAVPVAGRVVDERGEGAVPVAGRVVDERGEGAVPVAGRVVDERGEGAVPVAGRVVDERGEGAVPVAGRVVDERSEETYRDPGDLSRVLAALAAHDPRPNASMQALAEAYPDPPAWSVSAVEPFTSAKKWSGMSFRDDVTGLDRGNWIIGAPDVLLDPAGETASLAGELGSTGLRILLLARTDVPVDTEPAAGAIAPGQVVPVALVVLEQRVRPDARDTLDYFASQHVSVKVISGDNARSVGAVAASLGLGSPDTSVDARELPTDETELAEVVDQGVTFGRVRPDQKRAMVHALQSSGNTVAMTGDGVNDVLALKDADIGVAMGLGSSAARSVAQIVLLDNKFATLPYVVGEGRRVIGNIERVSNLFLTKTVYAVLLALVVGVAGICGKLFGFDSLSYPFQPIHVTISAWFTIGIPAFVLSLAPNNERARPGFVRRVLSEAVPNGLIVGVATFVTYVIVNPGGEGVSIGSSDSVDLTPHQTQAATATLITLIAVALYVLAVVARPYTWWKVLLIAVSVLAYVVIFTWSWTQDLFKLDSSNLQMISVALISAAVGIVAVEIASRVIPRVIAARTDDSEPSDSSLTSEAGTA